MIICGLKLTHDGAVALLDEDRLIFSVEMEKLANRPRYSAIDDLAVVPEVLAAHGYSAAEVDEWVIDGWDGDVPGVVSLLADGTPLDIVVGPYREAEENPQLLHPTVTGELTIGGRSGPYTSYSHAAGHVAAVYATSPFAARGESSFVLVWDGGLFPRLYLVDPRSGVTCDGALFPMIGHAYATAGHHFGPWRRPSQSGTVDDLSVAGKLMAYIALGKPSEQVADILRDCYEEHFGGNSARARGYRAEVGGFGSLFEPSMPPLHDFYDAVAAQVEPLGVSDEDVLASVHEFLGDLLVSGITARVTDRPGSSRNLCIGGGCALNIKWNSLLRSLPVFDDVWVPPFPNDSGSAIGAAVLGRARRAGIGPITWHVRSGPALTGDSAAPDGWTAEPCDAIALARELHETGAPVVVLNGRAELGPRALGGRSIIAAPVAASTKDELNRIKAREHYRPVAPICMREYAPEAFAPGTPDPYMLFDHVVRPDWIRQIPAVVHLDGTARLQTVDADDDPFLHAVLSEYHARTGIPVLCNTSANLNGSGFFPDVASAASWGRIGRIWSAGMLYRRGTE